MTVEWNNFVTKMKKSSGGFMYPEGWVDKGYKYYLIYFSSWEDENPGFFECEDEAGPDYILSFGKMKYATEVTWDEANDLLVRYPQYRDQCILRRIE